MDKIVSVNTGYGNNDSLRSLHTLYQCLHGPSPAPLDAGGPLDGLQTALVPQDGLHFVLDMGRPHVALQSVIKAAGTRPQLSHLPMRLGTSKGAGSVPLGEGQAIRLDDLLSAGLEGPLGD